MFSAVRRATCFIASLAILVACSSGGGGGTGPDPSGGSISISVSPGTLVLKQGTEGDVTVTLTRSGSFSGGVTITATGVPQGVTVQGGTIQPGSGSIQLTVSVTSGVAPGNASITIQATGSGVSSASGTFTLTVEEEDVTGGFSLGLSTSNLSLEQGGTADVQIAVTRTGDFSGTVTFSATGLPAGVTAGFAPVSTDGASSTLTLAVGAAVGPASYTLGIQGSGDGVASQSATLTLQVTESVGGGELISFDQCFQATPITWMAFQDGSGPWNAVVPVGSVFSFEMAEQRGAVAVVQNAGGSPRITIMHLTADEMALLASDGCPIVYPSRSVSGSVAGVAPADLVNVSLGSAVQFLPPGTTDFQMTSLPDGPLDLLATQYTTFPAEFKKIVIRRNLSPADGDVLPVIDFSAPEAAAPVVNDLTIDNILGETTSTVVNYLLGDGVTGQVLYAEPDVSANPNRNYHGVPAALFQAGDLHRLTAQATAADLTTTRSVTRYFGSASPQTLTLPAAIGPTPIMPVANNPYVRLRLQYEPQADYDSYYTWFFSQNDGITTRHVAQNVSAGYLNGGAIDVTFPDFSSLTGWNDLWALQPGALITGSVSAVGWTGVGLIAFPIPEVGTRLFTGARVQIEINP